MRKIKIASIPLFNFLPGTENRRPTDQLISGLGRNWLLALLPLFMYTVASGQEARTLPLAEAQTLALQQNKLLKISREKVAESEFKVTEARSQLFPMIRANGNYLYNGVTRDLALPAGSFGSLQGISLPQKEVTLFESKHHLLFGGVLVYQPISLLWKISSGVSVARTDVEIARTEVSKAEQEIKQGVEKLYFGLLIAQKRQQEATLNIQLAEAKLYDVESGLLAGKTDPVNKIGLQADLANLRQKQLEISNQIEDYTFDLNEALGLPASTQLTLLPMQDTLDVLQPVATYVATAQTHNLDIRSTEQTRLKAAYGVQAARREYIPVLGAVGGYYYQNIITDLPERNYMIGLQLSWTIYDFGGRRSVLNQRLSLQKQAEEHLKYTREQVEGRIAKAHRKVKQAYALTSVAQEAVKYRTEEYKLKKDRLDAGLTLQRDVLETQAALLKAEADLFAAQLNYRLALTELQNATGGTL
jgi:outer membrane protein TolC